MAEGCQHFQISWFHSAPESDGAYDLFRRTFGSEPDRSNRNKFPKPNNPVLSAAEGVIAGYSITFQEQQGRYDIVLRPDEAEQANSNPEPFPVFNVYAASEFLLNAVREGGVSFEKCYRQALVIHLIEVANDRQHADQMFFGAIGARPSEEPLLDLLYQYNKRVERKSDGFVVNRLVRHSVENSRFYKIAAPVGVMGIQFNPSNHVPDSETFAHQTVLDINNHPDGRIIPAEQQANNFSDFFDQATRVTGVKVS